MIWLPVGILENCTYDVPSVVNFGNLLMILALYLARSYRVELGKVL